MRKCTQAQAAELKALDERTDLEDHQKALEAFLVFNPEYQDEIKKGEDPWLVSLPMAKAFARWSASTGMCSAEEATQCILELQSHETT